MLAERINALCAEKGVTISGVERDLGFGNGTMRKWKKAMPRLDKLKMVANYFGVTVDELLMEDTE